MALLQLLQLCFEFVEVEFGVGGDENWAVGSVFLAEFGGGGEGEAGFVALVFVGGVPAQKLGGGLAGE